MKIKFTAAFLLLSILSGCYEHKIEENKPITPPIFIIESGPQELGYSRISIIRHIETGKRYIYTERSSMTVITPLDN